MISFLYQGSTQVISLLGRGWAICAQDKPESPTGYKNNDVEKGGECTPLLQHLWQSHAKRAYWIIQIIQKCKGWFMNIHYHTILTRYKLCHDTNSLKSILHFKISQHVKWCNIINKFSRKISAHKTTYKLTIYISADWLMYSLAL